MTQLTSAALSNKHERYRRIQLLESMTVPFRLLSTTLYHISFDPQLAGTLVPQNPAGGDMDAEPSEISEPSLPRVCFSTTIRGCVRAVFPNWKELLKGGNVITFNVYRAIPNRNHMFVPPEALSKERIVHDALVTQEHISLTPVEIEFVGKATATLDVNGEWLYYHLFGTGVGQQSHSPLKIDIELHGV